jgi:hypothetical protein
MTKRVPAVTYSGYFIFPMRRVSFLICSSPGVKSRVFIFLLNSAAIYSNSRVLPSGTRGQPYFIQSEYVIGIPYSVKKPIMITLRPPAEGVPGPPMLRAKQRENSRYFAKAGS